MTPLEVIEFHQKINNSEEFFTEGGCYIFYLVLKTHFKAAVPYYNQDHIITKIKDKYYDITGEVQNNNFYRLDSEPKDLKFFIKT